MKGNFLNIYHSSFFHSLAKHASPASTKHTSQSAFLIAKINHSRRHFDAHLRMSWKEMHSHLNQRFCVSFLPFRLSQYRFVPERLFSVSLLPPSHLRDVGSESKKCAGRSDASWDRNTCHRATPERVTPSRKELVFESFSSAPSAPRPALRRAGAGEAVPAEGAGGAGGTFARRPRETGQALP